MLDKKGDILMKRIIFFIALSFFLGTVSAAENTPLYWKGPSEMKQGFMQEMVALYKKMYGTDVILRSSEGSAGIRQVAARQLDAGGSGRSKISGDPAERLIRVVPVAWDMLAVMTHQDNLVHNISLVQLKEVLEGKITNWRELGGDDAPIKVLTLSDPLSGVAYSLNERLWKDPNKKIPLAESFDTVEALNTRLLSDPAAMTIESFVVARKMPVNILAVDGTAPSYDAGINGQYPLFRPLYFTYVSLRNKRLGEIKKLLKLAYSNPVKETMQENGLVPYLASAKLVDLEKTRHSRRKIAALQNKTAKALDK